MNILQVCEIATKSLSVLYKLESNSIILVNNRLAQIILEKEIKFKCPSEMIIYVLTIRNT